MLQIMVTDINSQSYKLSLLSDEDQIISSKETQFVYHYNDNSIFFKRQYS